MSISKMIGKIADWRFWAHLLAMLLVMLLFCIGVKVGLDIYTRHGQEVEVPNIMNMSFDQAKLLLDEYDLNIQVADSGYNKRMPADCILAQMPGATAKVKAGHIIYVTVNSPSSPTVTIPDIIDNSSLREAEAKLAAMGFKLLPPKRIVGEKDWVYGIISRGRRVGTGDRVSTDAPLTLIVGTGGYEAEEDDMDYYSDPIGGSDVGTTDTNNDDAIGEDPTDGIIDVDVE
ncbi:MAG: PASTA domain-containing protein [Prevotella sp.]|nr:PASTA domain-containing protein [Prevotella sp.]